MELLLGHKHQLANCEKLAVDFVMGFIVSQGVVMQREED